MPPTTPPTYVYTTREDVESLLSADGLAGRLDDDASGGVVSSELAHLTQAIRWATARINMHLVSYSFPELAQSWLVNWYATVIAAHMISCRRGNPAAGSLQDTYEGVMEDLARLKTGEFVLPDAALRDSAFPAWSSLSAPRLGARVQRLRVQTSLSSKRGNRSGQAIDLPAQIIGDVEKRPH